MSSVRLLTAKACELDLDLCHFDIGQSDLEDNVDMRLPQGSARMSGKIVRPNQSLYGLNQASRQLHAHLTRCFLSLGLFECLALMHAFSG